MADEGSKPEPTKLLTSNTNQKLAGSDEGGKTKQPTELLTSKTDHKLAVVDEGDKPH